MFLFDFHHHHPQKKSGLYNANILEDVFTKPFSIGLHPKDIDENWKKNLQVVKDISADKNCKAIGECGLDRLIAVDFELQKSVFEAQIDWANEIQKPIIIHCVRSFSETIALGNKSKVQMVIHGFNKKNALAQELLSHGFFLSFGKAVLNRVSLQLVIKEVPLEKIFLETDDSDFEIVELYQKVADIKSISVEELQNQIQKNLENTIK